MSEVFISRWGIPEADDFRWLHIPGFIMRHWAKFVSVQEWAFILQVMSFKYDSMNGKASPSLETISREMGYENVRSIQRIKKSLVKKKLLNIEERKGQTDIYEFKEFALQCQNADKPTGDTDVITSKESPVVVNNMSPVVVTPESPKESEESKSKKNKNKKDSAPSAQEITSSQENLDDSTTTDSDIPSVDETPEIKETGIADEAEQYLINKTETRKRLFAGICKLSFNLDPDNSETESALKANNNSIRKRIQKIVTWLLELDTPATPDELWEFYKWWPQKYPNLSAPCDYGKFARYYINFRQDDSKSSNTYHYNPFRVPSEEDYRVNHDYEIDMDALMAMIPEDRR